MVLNLDSVSQFQRFGSSVHPNLNIPEVTLCGPVCALIKYLIIWIFFELEDKKYIVFSNYEGFDEFLYGTC